MTKTKSFVKITLWNIIKAMTKTFCLQSTVQRIGGWCEPKRVKTKPSLPSRECEVQKHLRLSEKHSVSMQGLYDPMSGIQGCNLSGTASVYTRLKEKFESGFVFPEERNYL